VPAITSEERPNRCAIVAIHPWSPDALRGVLRLFWAN
jgi:hypothetical protein